MPGPTILQGAWVEQAVVGPCPVAPSRSATVAGGQTSATAWAVLTTARCLRSLVATAVPTASQLPPAMQSVATRAEPSCTPTQRCRQRLERSTVELAQERKAQTAVLRYPRTVQETGTARDQTRQQRQGAAAAHCLPWHVLVQVAAQVAVPLLPTQRRSLLRVCVRQA